MKRISILLDDVAFVRSVLNSDAFDPVKFGILCETAGANSLVCTYSGSEKGIRDRDLKLLKEVGRTYLNVRIPVNEEAVRLALSLTPDMITFVDVKPTDFRNVQPLDPEMYIEEIQHSLGDLRASNISVSVYIQPEINILKNINKLAIDYVEIDTGYYTAAPDVNEELIALDRIKSAAIAATKLGLGVNCCGGIRFEHITALAHIPNIEDIVLGAEIVERSIWTGVERAVSEALQLLRHREIEQ